MSTCTFFGHRDCPESVRAQVKEAVENLIVYQNVDTFYVGNQGHFDAIVRSVLREMAQKYPHIRYAVVLSAMPNGAGEYGDTMLPEGIEAIHPRFAVDWRNTWMLKRSNYVVSYVTHGWGGAAKFAQKAQKAGKTVIALA